MIIKKKLIKKGGGECFNKICQEMHKLNNSIWFNKNKESRSRSGPCQPSYFDDLYMII